MALQGYFSAPAKRLRAEHRRRYAERRSPRTVSSLATEEPSLLRAAGCRERRSVLRKVADMQTKPTGEPSGSPVPGVIPEPIRVRHDAVAANERDGVPTDQGSSPRRRNVARGPLAKLLSALRGDKYMVDAYPPARDEAKER
jgi:hypothetical protein